MIKRLTYFTDDAWNLSWEQFKKKHDFHVIVMVPVTRSAEEKKITDRYDSVEERDSRPPINDDYRVGVLTKLEASDSGAISVGRLAKNDIVVSNIEVSKVHAIFEPASDGWAITDNGSTNGTYVNGERLTSGDKVELKSSDSVKIGPGVSAVFFDTADFYQFLRSTEVRAHLG